nr:NBS-containing resistance-like protein [Tanacetum cinerariifolium]
MSMNPMVTRAKARIFKPLECMTYHVITTSPLPHSHVHALRDSNWKEAMLDEYNALISNETWVLVPRPANVNVVRSMNPVDTESKLGPDGDSVFDSTLFHILVDNILSWFAKRRVTVSRSSVEAEYHGVANVVAATAWIRNLLLELHAPLHSFTLVYYDNVSAVYLSTN